METHNVNLEDKVKLPDHIQTPDQIYQWVDKYASLFKSNLLHKVMNARGYTQNSPEGPWEKINTESDIEKSANHFINAFGEHALKVIQTTRNSVNLYHPSQEDLFSAVEKKLFYQKEEDMNAKAKAFKDAEPEREAKKGASKHFGNL